MTFSHSPNLAVARSDERLHAMTFETIGFDVYGETSDGYVLHAMTRPAMGGAKFPSLGVEDYVFVAVQRKTQPSGARSLCATDRKPTPEQTSALRARVRQHLADLDARRITA